MIPQDSALEREHKGGLIDKATQLLELDAYLAGRINRQVMDVMESHMRLMNSYYSNLIEGNPTKLHEIREAMAGSFPKEEDKKNYAQESIAHINVQAWLKYNPPTKESVYSKDFICSIHKHFLEQVPEAHRIVWNDDRTLSVEVIPGEIRKTDASAGHHVAPPHEKIDSLLQRFEEAYDLSKTYKVKHVIGAMAAHHRLVWIHPFADGNGRTVRLHTDEVLKVIGMRSVGIWCLSRGLAKSNELYKVKLANADHPRKGDTDGRGDLSESALIDFCHFMLDAAIDQVKFMTNLLEVQGADQHIKSYVKARQEGRIFTGNPEYVMGSLRDEAIPLLQKLFTVGEIPRGDIPAITGLKERTARSLVKQLVDEGLAQSETHRATIKWALPEHAEEYYFKNLAPRN